MNIAAARNIALISRGINYRLRIVGFSQKLKIIFIFPKTYYLPPTT
ncbi:MAG: hypothetical protein UT90_C0004G0042 [Parcubacteria group bacterium GW2011_GWA1_40_21]|nr:MAG: hypothetical protein UT80_C0032G0005 [Parcubacteria group bacterium GW2011_GWC1_40_13]KKR53857.1 MAG: hypothetical protein UT90_C0004G0042 [Parcubacteria group bacterium GW2011_GWA1_40_21]